MHQDLPYDSSRASIFWRSAVANVNPETDFFNELTRVFPISKSHQISSAGSCFAQHIGNWLTQNEYQYLRSQLNTTEVSSFAYGNIYTPRSLLQWFLKSDEDLSQYSTFLDGDSGKYFDMLLPNSCPDGYESLAELSKYRVSVLDETRAQLRASDTFIFTLGLIETWVDINGVCYPSCPGLKAGKYDPELYRLKVFDYNEILSDLSQLFQHIRAINPEITFVLTVSPVPLTATATENHILVANAYSKSVLRAVAGAISESHQDINYFPSFELITTPLPEDFRFLENRRTVSSDGVNFVMRHWAKSLNSERKIENNIRFLEAECDEEMLDALNKHTSTDSSSQSLTLMTLVGDSHFGKLAKALDRKGKKYCGGMVMNGSAFAQQKFALTNDTDIMVPMESADSRMLWHKITANLNNIRKEKRQSESCVITNIGLQTHQTVVMFLKWMQAERPNHLSKISSQDYVDFLNLKMHEQMTIVFHLKDQGHRVIVVSDPPFWPYFEESKKMAPIAAAYMNTKEYVWQQMGVEFFHASRCFNEEVPNPMDYASTLVFDDGTEDYFHGGEQYYDWLAEKLIKLVNTKP